MSERKGIEYLLPELVKQCLAVEPDTTCLLVIHMEGGEMCFNVGSPWTKEQVHEALTKYLLDEPTDETPERPLGSGG